MCSHVCSVFYWLIGDALLMYSGIVSLFRLHTTALSQFLGYFPIVNIGTEEGFVKAETRNQETSVLDLF